MGFGPREVDDMTLWELNACVAGWSKAQGFDSAQQPFSDDEHDALLTRYAHH